MIAKCSPQFNKGQLVYCYVIAIIVNLFIMYSGAPVIKDKKTLGKTY